MASGYAGQKVRVGVLSFDILEWSVPDMDEILMSRLLIEWTRER